MQPEAFEVKFAEAVERSFRDDAIRTAVLIDDQFPDYLRMHGAKEEEFAEIERAKNIYAFMHGKGLVCDIQNWRVPTDTDLPLLEKVRKSDLIVLDYQLGVAGPGTALKILRHLAISPHFNLVVLYTAEASPLLALTVAAAMRGAKPTEKNLMPSETVLGNSEDILADGRFQDVDAAGLRDYLTDGRTPWARDLSEAMTAARLPLNELKALSDYIARRWITTLLAGYEQQTDVELPLGCAIDSDLPLWVHCGSCFVAIVSKLPVTSKENEGEYVWGKLGVALRAWRPNLYRLILSEIQNALELEAVAHHENWLDDKLALGLGLYVLESKEAAEGGMSPSDIEGAAQSLIDRFVDIIRRRLASHERISTTAVELLGARLATEIGQPVASENARHVRARELANYPSTRVIDWKNTILPAVNAFMVSDTFRGSHITTGTVLRGPDDSYWLCASPACDLVPREDGPTLVQLIRLQRTTSAPEKFTTGEFIAISGAGGAIILRALEIKARQPSLMTLVLPRGTTVKREVGGPAMISGWIATDARLRAVSVAHGFTSEKTLQVAPDMPLETIDQHSGAAMFELVSGAAQFVILSQLRSGFATRFLMVAGQHQSRVGVDYVDP